MSFLRGSTNYVWCTTSVLGKGATGAVFQGVNKHNGETVAVKTFNQLSHMRPQEVQMREFEVLQKVKHENIVKLLAIEEEQEGRGKVIVMELCTGQAGVLPSFLFPFPLSPLPTTLTGSLSFRGIAVQPSRRPRKQFRPRRGRVAAGAEPPVGGDEPPQRQQPRPQVRRSPSTLRPTLLFRPDVSVVSETSSPEIS